MENPLAPFFSDAPMSGLELAHIRSELSLVLGIKVNGIQMAEMLGTHQTTLSRWENIDEVPHRVATIARLLLRLVPIESQPQALRPGAGTLALMADVLSAIDGEPPHDGAANDLVRIQAAASVPRLIEWRTAFEQTLPASDTQPAA